jgi:hypothetical protein
MAPNYPGQHSHFFLIIWANSSVPECAGLRGTTEKGLLISGSQVRALLGSPFSINGLTSLQAAASNSLNQNKTAGVTTFHLPRAPRVSSRWCPAFFELTANPQRDPKIRIVKELYNESRFPQFRSWLKSRCSDLISNRSQAVKGYRSPAART